MPKSLDISINHPIQAVGGPEATLRQANKFVGGLKNQYYQILTYLISALQDLTKKPQENITNP